jgi:hypothetical protein
MKISQNLRYICIEKVLPCIMGMLAFILISGVFYGCGVMEQEYKAQKIVEKHTTYESWQKIYNHTNITYDEFWLLKDQDLLPK